MGRFVKGQAKPAGSGRKPGVGNRVPSKIFSDVLEQLQSRDFSVIDEAVKLYRSRKTNIEMKVRLLTVLAGVSFPKKLAVASIKKVQHSYSIHDLMQDPALAKHMEALTFALEGKRAESKLLPAPAQPEGSGLPIADGETEDLPDPPRATGLGI